MVSLGDENRRAVAYATSVLPEGFRANATIATGEITLHWGDIERWGKPV
jgi:hypothetical protein